MGTQLRGEGMTDDQLPVGWADEDLRSLLEMSSDLLCVASAEGVFLKVSPSFTHILGHPQRELVGSHLLDFVHPDDRGRTVDVIAGPGPVLGFVNRYRCADGSWRRIEWTAQAGEGGREGLVYAVGRDVTRRALEAADQGLRAAIAVTMSEAAYALRSADGIIVYADERFEAMFGYERGEMIGRHASIVNAPTDVAPEETARQIMAEIAEQGRWRGQIENIRKSGERFWCSANVTLYDHPLHGELMVAVHTDITEAKRAGEERKRLARRLEHRQKLESLGVLAGGIAHDFNNLLTVILGSAEVALSEVEESSELSRALETVRLVSLQASELSNQMLAYSGRSRFVIEQIDLNRLLTRMQPLLSASLPKRASPTWDLGAELPTVAADATQLRQVVLNLLSNATDAVDGRTPQIVVSTRLRELSAADLAEGVVADRLPAGQYVSLEVRDNGRGMKPATRLRLFEPFFTTKFAGRGLGLAVVLGIVRGHSGTIVVRSTLGEGTSFEVLLPTAGEIADTAVSVPAVPPVAVGPPWHRGRPVLVVDDEPLVRDVSIRALRSAGVTAIAASGGPHALELFGAPGAEFCAVLLDRTMPEMSGEEVCVHLRAIRSDVPILMFSGYSADDMATLPAESRPDGFLPKPFTRSRLLAALRDVVLGAGG